LKSENIVMLIDAFFNLIRPIRFRGKARLLGPLSPRSGRREARVFGSRVTLDLSDYIGRSIYLGAYERRETALVSQRLKPGMTFLDVGANIGYFSLLAASRVGPSGRVVAVEPSPLAYRELVKAIEENTLPIEPHQVGLGDAPGECTLYFPPVNFHNHSPTMVHHEGAGTPVRVTVARLDDCLDEWGLASVDLMKIDVEGYEPNVFAGAHCSLRSGRIKALLCEFNDVWLRAAGSSPQAVHDTLLGLGFIDQAGAPQFREGQLETRFLVHETAAGTKSSQPPTASR
jgi:FkbM family methyltransferase